MVTMTRLMSYFGRENIGKLMHRANVYVWNQVRNEPRKLITHLSESDIDGVRRFMEELPNDTTRTFELSVTDYADHYNTEEMKKWLSNIIADTKEKERVRYYAFYTINIMLRRSKDYAEIKKLFDIYGNEFKHYKSYSHLWLLLLITGYIKGFDYDEALGLAWQDCEEFNDNAGFIHTFPSLYVNIFERASAAEAFGIKNKWSARAMRAVDMAIAASLNDKENKVDYAKYYCTKARVLCIAGDYENAILEIEKAISKEDSTNNYYAIQHADYLYYKAMIQIEKRYSALKENS